MFNWLLSTDIIGGTTPPPGLVPKEPDMVAGIIFIAIFFGLIIGIPIIGMIIKEKRCKNKSNNKENQENSTSNEQSKDN